MKTIRLYGELAKKFGKEFKLEVRTAAEAVRALCVMVKGFREHLEAHSEPGYVVRVHKTAKAIEELHDPVSSKETIKIIPVVAGASAFGRIILGAALVAFAIFNPLGLAAVSIGTTTVGSIALGIGMSLILGGVAELLAPSPPKMEGMRPPEQTPSYMFDGPVNTMGAGYAVPVGYGELLVGSHVISAELFSVEEPIGGTSATSTRKAGILGIVNTTAEAAYAGTSTK